MDGLLRYKFRRTTIITMGLAAFLLGLVAAKQFELAITASSLILAVPLLLVSKRKTLVALAAIILVGMLFGVWRGGMMQRDLARYKDFQNQPVTVYAFVRDDPVYDGLGQLDFRVGNVKIANESFPGQMRIRGRINDLRRGDSVKIEGILRPGFGNYQASMSFASVAVAGRSTSWTETVRREFFAATYNVLPDLEASLGLGFLLGLRSALPEEFDKQLRVAGLTHIVVASGYNLTVLVRLSRRLLAKRSKYQAFACSIGLILGFVAITGASPSISRAAVVTGLSLSAWYYGRRVHPILLILLGAALTAGYSPLYIWHDLGWWLSFLAFAGVLVLAPLLTKRLFKSKQPKLIPQVAIETISAQIMATPLIMLIFGEISLAAIIANVAVVPLIPFAMLFTFIGGLAGVVSPLLGSWLALPAHFILGYIVSVTRVLSSLPWAQLEIEISSGSLALLYGLVIIFAAIIYSRARIRFRELPAVVE